MKARISSARTRAGRASVLVHPASEYVGLRFAKSFVRAGEGIDVDLAVTDIDGKIVGGREIVVKAGLVTSSWGDDDEAGKEEDVQTCRVTSASGAAGATGANGK